GARRRSSLSRRGISRRCSVCCGLEGCRLATPPAAPWLTRLLTNAERGDDLAVPLDVVAAQVVEQAAALADELQETAARVVVLRVRLEVLREVGDALGEQRDLHLGR